MFLIFGGIALLFFPSWIPVIAGFTLGGLPGAAIGWFIRSCACED